MAVNLHNLIHQHYFASAQSALDQYILIFNCLPVAFDLTTSLIRSTGKQKKVINSVTLARSRSLLYF